MRINYGITLAAAASLLVGATGCQNRMARERNEAIAQSKELQRQLDEARNRPPVVVTPVPAAAVQPPAPPAAPPSPQPAAQPLQPAQPPQDTIRPLDIQDPEIEVATDQAKGTVTVNVSGDVLFSSGQADLRVAAKQTLDKVIAALQREHPGKRIRIEGHTDSDPIRKSKWESNEALSVARADAVRNYLVSKGIDGGLITTKGLGATQPRGQVKSKNRRVEIVVVVR